MGCASSKLDDLPAVQLCRDRLHNLSQALQHRHDLSQAHLQYIHALQSVGMSLHRFFDNAASSSSPSITINENRKLEMENKEEKKKNLNHKSDKKNSGHLSSDDDSGSHLHFHSDDEDDDDDENDDGELHHDHGLHGSGSESGSGHLPHHQEMEGKFAAGGMMMYEEGPGFGGGGGYGFGSGSGYDYNPYLYSSNGYGGGGGGGTVHMNYMKKHVTPSVSYEQRPMSYETQTVQFGDPSNSNYYDYFGGGGGYFGPVPAPQRGGYYGPPVGVQPMKQQQQQQAPPPPPPPATSSWDFMNLFESLETHYSDFRPPSSRDSREVREEEGIPELEEEMEEGYANEVVKEVHGHQKVVMEERGEGSSSSGGREAKRVGEVEEEEEVVVDVSEVESGNVYRGRPSVSMESAPVEYEVRMVDKKVVGEDGKGGGGGGRPVFRNVFEVVKEIQVQFERAANCGSELGNVLEVGKLRYQRKNAAFQGWEIGV